jgi:iron(III) transport system permease protein
LQDYLNKILLGCALVGTGIILGLIIIYPPAVLVKLTFFPREGLSDLPQILGEILSRGTRRAFLNSLFTASGVFLFSTFTGTVLAWLRVRTNLPGKAILDALVLLAFIIPPYILGIAWMQLFGSGGYLNRIISLMSPDTEYSFPYYSIGAAVIVLGLHLYPLIYFSIRNNLQQLDPLLETAAVQCGASRLHTFTSITLPGILPGMLSAGLLVFSRAIANFSVPALLCLPVRKEMITTRIYASLGSLDSRTAALLSFCLVLVSTLLYVLQLQVLRRFSWGNAKKPGNLPQEQGSSLGRYYLPVSFITAAFFLVTIGLPLGAMLISSFMKRWGLPLKGEYLTLHNYVHLLSGEKTRKAFVSSLSFGAGAGIIALGIGGTVALLSHTIRSRSSRLIEAVASWPMAFPNITLAVAAILTWNRAPFFLYGTPYCIIATYAALFTPIVMKQIAGLLENQDPRLIHAARTSGAGPVGCFLTVTLPTILPGVGSGLLLCILIALREIPIALMLYSAGQETVGVLLFGMQSQSYGLEMTSALAITVIALIFTGNLVIQKIKRRVVHV